MGSNALLLSLVPIHRVLEVDSLYVSTVLFGDCFIECLQSVGHYPGSCTHLYIIELMMQPNNHGYQNSRWQKL